jgi:hypothetical protein
VQAWQARQVMSGQIRKANSILNFKPLPYQRRDTRRANAFADIL